MAYPNLGEAAAILDVSKATLSRRQNQLSPIRVGNQLRFSPASLIREAVYHRRRRLAAVGQSLVDYAREHEPFATAEIQDEVDRALETVTLEDALTYEGFLSDAQKALPPEVYARVEAVIKNADKILSTPRIDQILATAGPSVDDDTIEEG